MLVVDPHVRAAPNAVRAVRTVTVLGATGSVGMSTVDLLKRGNGHYSVEAVTAHKNGGSLRRSRATSRHCGRRRPDAYGDLKAALFPAPASKQPAGRLPLWKPPSAPRTG